MTIPDVLGTSRDFFLTNLATTGSTLMCPADRAGSTKVLWHGRNMSEPPRPVPRQLGSMRRVDCTSDGGRP